MVRVRVVTDGAELLELRDTWDDVARQSHNCSVFATWEWVYTWLRHFGGHDRLNIVVLLDDDRVVAIAPLLRSPLGRRPLRFDALLPIGAENSDYSGFLLGAQPDESARVLADYLLDAVAETNAVVHLMRFIDDDPMLEALRTRSRARPTPVTLVEHNVGSCPYVDLSEGSEAAQEVARGKKRNDLPRRMRRLREHHEVDFKYHVGGDNLDGAWREVMRLHELRWDDKADEMHGLLSDQGGRAFAAEVVRALDAAGIARVSLLTADGAPISASLGFEIGSRYHYHKPGFDPAYSKYAPGNLLIGELLDAAVARGLDEFNFGRGDATYKYSWAERERSLTSVWVTRSHLRGRLQRSIVYRNRRNRLSASGRELEGPWASLPALA